MGNMDIYERVRSVPEHARKTFNNGRFKGTDVNPMWRLKTLTELFGPCGTGWYIEVLKREMIPCGDELIAIVDINLYVKVDGEWSKPIFGTGGNKLLMAEKAGQRVSDEGFKMAYTDAISVACKALGIAADVYFERDTSSKYARSYTEQDGAAGAQAAPNVGSMDRNGLITQEHVKAILTCCSKAEVGKILEKYGLKMLSDMEDELAVRLIPRLEERRREGNPA